MSKLVIGLAAFILLAAGGALAGNALTGSSPNVTTTATTSTTPGTTTNDDLTTSTVETVETGEDVSGPCDEAEHANDPRCTGAAPAGEREDRADDVNDDRGHSNRGRGGDDDHGQDDRSGSNHGSDD